MTAKANEKLAKAYVDAVGICAVVVTEKRRSNVASLRVRKVVDFSASQTARRTGAGKVDRFVWCSDVETAECLVHAAIEEVIARQISGKGRRVMLPAEELFAIVQMVAVRENIAVTPHQRVVARAMAIVDRVNAAYAPGSPQLKALNQAYRRHRLAEEAHDRSAPGYTEWLLAHKNAALQAIAAPECTRRPESKAEGESGVRRRARRVG